MEALCKKIQSQLAQHLPFVAYRKPGTNAVAMLFQEDATLHTITDYSESGFVFAPFNSARKTLYIPAQHHLIHPWEKQDTLPQPAPPETTSDSRKEAHLQLVSKGIAAIKKGRFKKVVLSRKETIPLPGPEVPEIYKKLLAAYPNAFCYLWYHPETGPWLGATPETLLTVENNRFSTMALAGTRKFTGAANISWNQKEKEEQQLVTDFITARLAPLSTTLNTTAPYTIKAGNLLHLRTDITGNFAPSKEKQETLISKDKSLNINKIIHALHPTPAVCGYPAEAARQFILEHEDYDRKFYTGFLGELHFSAGASRNPTALYVNLRCMQLTPGNAQLYVGGGITAASVPEQEWEETRNKARIMGALLSPSSPL